MAAANDNTGKQGFASMDEEKQKKIASDGGKAQGKENNPANFANDESKASKAGKEGGQKSQSDDNE